jgi:hypothetical protein
VWVINGTRDLGQFDCVVGQLSQGCALFDCGFLFDGRSGGGVLEGLTAIGVQISSACKGLTAREKAAMFPSMYSVADWLKRRMDKPKLLARTPMRCIAMSPRARRDTAAQVLHRCRDASEWLQLLQVPHHGLKLTNRVSAVIDAAAAGDGRSHRLH